PWSSPTAWIAEAHARRGRRDRLRTINHLRGDRHARDPAWRRNPNLPWSRPQRSQTMSLRPAIALLAALALALPATADAAFFVVNNTADVPEETPGDGTCNPQGAIGNTCTLRAAIQEANALGGAHVIGVASGNYSITRNGIGEDAASTGDFDITADITLLNATNNTPIISAVSRDRVFDVLSGGKLTLIGVHVHGGYANAPGNIQGGGIRVADGATLVLQESIVSTNLANIGGAIYSDGDVTIIDSELFNNVLVAEQV